MLEEKKKPTKQKPWQELPLHKESSQKVFCSVIQCTNREGPQKLGQRSLPVLGYMATQRETHGATIKITKQTHLK